MVMPLLTAPCWELVILYSAFEPSRRSLRMVKADGDDRSLLTSQILLRLLQRRQGLRDFGW